MFLRLCENSSGVRTKLPFFSHYIYICTGNGAIYQYRLRTTIGNRYMHAVEGERRFSAQVVHGRLVAEVDIESVPANFYDRYTRICA